MLSQWLLSERGFFCCLDEVEDSDQEVAATSRFAVQAV